MKEASEVRLGVQVRQEAMEEHPGVASVAAQLLDADVDDRLAIGVVAVGAHLLQLLQRLFGALEGVAHHQRQTPAPVVTTIASGHQQSSYESSLT